MRRNDRDYDDLSIPWYVWFVLGMVAGLVLVGF